MRGSFIPIIYGIGYIATYIYLVILDWQESPNFLAWLFCAGIDIFLATIWPIYWTLLHWM